MDSKISIFIYSLKIVSLSRSGWLLKLKKAFRYIMSQKYPLCILYPFYKQKYQRFKIGF